MAHAYFHFVGASQLFKLLLQVIHNLKKDKTKKIGQVERQCQSDVQYYSITV